MLEYLHIYGEIKICTFSDIYLYHISIHLRSITQLVWISNSKPEEMSTHLEESHNFSWEIPFKNIHCQRHFSRKKTDTLVFTSQNVELARLGLSSLKICHLVVTYGIS